MLLTYLLTTDDHYKINLIHQYLNNSFPTPKESESESESERERENERSREGSLRDRGVGLHSVVACQASARPRLCCQSHCSQPQSVLSVSALVFTIKIAYSAPFLLPISGFNFYVRRSRSKF